MDLIDIERDKLKERVRKERVRELEKELYRTDHALHTADAYGHTLEERIAKAKAILESDEYADHDPKSEIQRALAALEGK